MAIERQASITSANALEDGVGHRAGNVLAELDVATIRRCLAEGLIDPKLTGKQARILVAQLKGRPIPEPVPDFSRRLRTFRAFILENLAGMTVSERNSVSSELRDLLALITAKWN